MIRSLPLAVLTPSLAAFKGDPVATASVLTRKLMQLFAISLHHVISNKMSGGPSGLLLQSFLPCSSFLVYPAKTFGIRRALSSHLRLQTKYQRPGSKFKHFLCGAPDARAHAFSVATMMPLSFSR